MAVSTNGVGDRLRALREGMHLSLRDFAERSGVSTAMLSQVERGETSPTIAVATRIAAGLDLSLSQLLRLEEGAPVTVIRAEERRQVKSPRSRHGYEILTPPLPGQRAEVSLHNLKRGGATGTLDDPPLHEPGSRETVVVQAGHVRLVVDGTAYELEAGDAVTFDSDLSHHFENGGDDDAVFLSVVAAGLRRS